MASSHAELYAQLLPLSAGCLLLPRAGVLEVQSMGGTTLATAGPGWLLGFAQRDGHDVAVVSLEAMAGLEVPARTRQSRLVVLKGLGVSLENPVFAIVSQGPPKLIQVNAGTLQKRPIAPDEAEVALSGVRLANRDAVIPDLESIERRISEAWTTVTGAAAIAEDWEPGASLDLP